ncbi:uncharacterized protein METZ01_LOCUS179319, partial [marine metagenome]
VATNNPCKETTDHLLIIPPPVASSRSPHVPVWADRDRQKIDPYSLTGLERFGFGLPELVGGVEELEYLSHCGF